MRPPLRLFLSVLLLGLFGGCSSTGPEPTASSTDEVATFRSPPFPKHFLFGTAIAGFQVDMGCPTMAAAQCEDRNSDWYQWVSDFALGLDPRTFVSKQPVSAGPGFRELYEADLDRAKYQLHNNALRLSIEWSRVFPTSTIGIEGNEALRAVASQDALQFYHSIFAALRARGMKPMVTLNHYSLPLWIHDGRSCHFDIEHCAARGWLDKDVIVPEIAKYAGFVAREFGADVDLWATMNEPFSAVVLAGYLVPSPSRTNPPGVLFRVEEAKAAMAAMIEAHARMYDALHANDQVDADGDGQNASVGLVYNIQAIAPMTGNAEDAQAARDLTYVMKNMFLDAVVKGDFDPGWSGNQVHRADLANRMDYLGINYYARLLAQKDRLPFIGAIAPKVTFVVPPAEDDNDPDGIYDVLMQAKDYGVPMMITETGSMNDTDTEGASWLTRTLVGVQHAMADGADVRGYFYWTLMDNYEWNHGMGIRMGLYQVDAADPAKLRTARSSVAVYGEIAGTGGISDSLRAKYVTTK